MTNLLAELVVRLLLAAALFGLIFLVAFCAYPPSNAGIKKLSGCADTLPEVIVTIAGKKYRIPAGPQSYVDFASIPDSLRSTFVTSARNNAGQHVFCSDDVAERANAEIVRIGRDEVITASQRHNFFTTYQSLNAIHFGTRAFARGWTPPTPVATGGPDASLMVVAISNYANRNQIVHITAGVNAAGFRIWSSCNEALLSPETTVCRVGIFRHSDGFAVYTGNVRVDALPLTGQPPPPQILEVASTLNELVTDFVVVD